jgi:hypothetical protein
VVVGDPVESRPRLSGGCAAWKPLEPSRARAQTSRMATTGRFCGTTETGDAACQVDVIGACFVDLPHEHDDQSKRADSGQVCQAGR